MPSFPGAPFMPGGMPPMMGHPGMMGPRPGMMGPGMGPPPGPPGPTMQMGMRPPGPAGPPLGPTGLLPALRRPVGAAVAKATTVYVGKIATTVPDEIIRRLLEACGRVINWKPTLDPLTQAPKGFGFCEFEEAEGVLRAIRLLNGVKLDGQELMLKSNTATQKYLEAYEADRDAARAAKAAAAAAKAADAAGGDAEGGEAGKEGGQGEMTDEQKEDLVMQTIMEIVTEREAAAVHSKAVNEVLSVAAGGGGGGNGPSVPALGGGGGARRDGPHGRDDARGGGPGGARDGEDRERDSAVDRERERRRREEEVRKREGERAYQDLLSRWERHERVPEAGLGGHAVAARTRGRGGVGVGGRPGEVGALAAGVCAPTFRAAVFAWQRQQREAGAHRESPSGCVRRAFSAAWQNVGPAAVAPRPPGPPPQPPTRAARSDAERTRERERDRQRDAERERQRHIKADLEHPDTDDELEPWRRRPLRGSRRLEERRKRRQKELAEDQADSLADGRGPGLVGRV
ncbi:RNA-binding protein 25 [Monoraphidium neglectum]|uniref:RNA-binding protein 25 n=1 Tax=Monoraphidium neglectum TaxID=145388 RepID=A0A0D2MII1_9CHLO|nr:RNA-binding protein 25 [Monoraphidium neglectum]KIY94795.1 RNA-binding protein 25 [Monoraphidium neglectum]|eukprot:XP_013893815.1 RNA-binding protein 25 [Monoraphidium neglectum]